MSPLNGLSMREVEALDECARLNQSRILYWFSPKTMALLHDRGFVEPWTPPSVKERPRLKARPWRLTDAGRQYRAQQSTARLVSTGEPS